MSSRLGERIITLTTDFGATDHFAGTMKGVILGIAPKVRLVDITHEIAPYGVTEAAYELGQSWRHFPKGTIHVAVVDPGVGTSRRPLLAEADGHFFIGPDNGVFSFIYAATRARVREITNPKFMLRTVSRTFHGRDVFAPAAAHLALRTPPASFGKLVKDAIHLEALQPARIGDTKSWSGVILKTDRFGNLITNFHVDQFGGAKTRPLEMRAGGQRIHRFALTYGDTGIGDIAVLVGSSGYLEIAANQASAAALLGCSAGAPVELELD